MSDRIEENESFKSGKEQLEGIEALGKISKLFSFFGIKDDSINELLKNTPNLKKQLHELSTTPDRYNDLLAERGWIAYESMNFDVMKKACKLVERSGVEEAEDYLLDYYSAKNIKEILYRLKALPECNVRYHVIKSALIEYEENRYRNAILILLTVIDGVVNDIDKGKGFFSSNINVTAWDSIAGHSSGLQRIQAIYNETRKVTNTNEIFLPYRNGIIHGRDINYSNKFVAAKCWVLVFAIRDWALALNNEPQKELVDLKSKNPFEALNDLKETLTEYSEHKKKIELQRVAIDNWKPRDLIIGIDLPSFGSPEDYKENTPEHSFSTFFSTGNHKISGKL